MGKKHLDAIIDRMGKDQARHMAVYDRMTLTTLGDVLLDFFNAERRRPNSNPNDLLLGITLGLAAEHSFLYEGFLKKDLSDEDTEKAVKEYMEIYSKNFTIAMRAGQARRKQRAKSE